MTRATLVLVTLLAVAAGRPAAAEQIMLFDGTMADSDWTATSVLQPPTAFDAGQVASGGNPGAFRRLRIFPGTPGFIDITDVSSSITHDPAVRGAVVGLSVAFDVNRLDGGTTPQGLTFGFVQSGGYRNLSGVDDLVAGWSRHEFECFDLAPGGQPFFDGSPAQFAFHLFGGIPDQATSPAIEIGVDNVTVAIWTAPDSCVSFSSTTTSTVATTTSTVATTTSTVATGPQLEITGTDNGHRWRTNPVIPYVLTVTNSGDQAMPAVRVTERVPVMTTFEGGASSSGWTCTGDGGEDAICTAPLGDLGPGESRSITFAARVREGTDPQWDVFNEARANPCWYGCTDYDVCGVVEGGSEYEFWCCALKIACMTVDVLDVCTGCLPSSPYCPIDARASSNLVSRATTAAPVASGTREPVELPLLYRLRDRQLHHTPGGRRATALYYRHSPAIGAALAADPALLVAGLDNLRLWQAALRALLEGTTATVSAAQLQGLLAFLDALRAAAPPALAAAIDRGRTRLRLDDWEGITIAEALARLDQLVCSTGATYASVVCRLGDAAELLETGAPQGALATRLLATLAKAETAARSAEAAAAAGNRRGARAGVRKAAKLAGKVVRAAKSRRGQRAIPDAVRTPLLAAIGAIRGDLKTLRRG